MIKRSVARGVVAAIISHYLVLFSLAALFWLLRPFVWAAIYGVPFHSQKGALDPASGEWLAYQAIGFLSWVAGGYAACRWNKPGSNKSILITGAIYLTLVLLGDAPKTIDLARIAIYYFEIPLALALGWFLFHRPQRSSVVLIEKESCE